MFMLPSFICGIPYKIRTWINVRAEVNQVLSLWNIHVMESSRKYIKGSSSENPKFILKLSTLSKEAEKKLRRKGFAVNRYPEKQYGRVYYIGDENEFVEVVK